MTPVGGGDLCDAQALGGGDDRRVDRVERKVAVVAYELGDPKQVRGVDRLENQRPPGEIAEKANLRLPAEARGDQIGDLGDDKRGNDQRPWVSLEQLETAGVVGVVCVDVGVERTRVDG